MTVKRLFDRILSQVGGAPFAVEYWDGERVAYGSGEPAFVLELRDRAVAESLFDNLSVRFGEAYADRTIEVHGDLQRLVRTMFEVDPAALELSWREKLSLALAAARQRNTLTGSRRNVAHHYDLGNPFFSLWLGREMAYSCAYFRSPGDDLDTAQEAKFRHLCRKLLLREGHRLLDVGCGWGGLVLHAAREHGARALGITLSAEQQREAARRVTEAGLDDHVRVELADYRELDGEAFDRVVSVGMFEHVGRENYPLYMRRTAELLAPGGVGVLHTIGRQVPEPTNPWILKHIFPGMYLPSLAEIVGPMGEADLHVVDVEGLRLHYAMTLDHWHRRFQEHVDEVGAMYDERFARMWSFYLQSCAASFRWGNLCLWQVTFTRGLSNDLPLTRDHLYAPV